MMRIVDGVHDLCAAGTLSLVCAAALWLCGAPVELCVVSMGVVSGVNFGIRRL